MVFRTIIQKASSITNSCRSTIPAGVMHQFSLSVGDKLEWELKVENGSLVIFVKPVKKELC